jgi:hypothetical protein
MGLYALVPPAGLGRHIGHHAPPFRRRHAGARRAVQDGIALMRIEIGNHPQEHAFSGSGLASNRDTFAGPKREIDRPQMKPTQCMAFEHAEELSFRVVGPIFLREFSR